MSQDFLFNLALLISLCAVSALMNEAFLRRRRWIAPVQGVLFGLTAVAGMIKHVEYAPGVYFDGRTMVLSLGAWFYGPAAGGISAGISLLYRISSGGQGVYAGSASILWATLAGIWMHRQSPPQRKLPGGLQILLFSVGVHGGTLLLFPLLLSLQVLQEIWWVFLFGFPLVSVLIGKLLGLQFGTLALIDELKRRTARLDMLTKNMREVFWVLDLERMQFTYVSPSNERMTGFAVKEVLGQPMENFLTSESCENVKKWLQEEMERPPDSSDASVGGRPLRLIEERCKDGGTVWTEVSYAVIHNPGGMPAELIGVSRDIRERMRMERELQNSLDEKDALLREVHHRVKNNLQVITSLLRLESGRIQHPYTREVLAEMRRRIRAMSVLHETVYQTENFSAVGMARYLKQLSRQISLSMSGGGSGTVKLKVDVADLHLPLEKAIPCGLLVNELLSNAYKHAFEPGESGEIVLKMGPVPDTNCCELSVTDTGRGLPPDFEARRKNLWACNWCRT